MPQCAASGRGVERLRTVYERYASRQLETGIVASNPAASEWGAIKRDIDGHRRGQAGSAISVLEGMVTAWAESPEKACGSPYATHAELRDDYVAQTIKRYVHTQTERCEKLRRKKVQEAYERVASYFERHAGWTWPYTKDAGAPDIAPQVLRELVGLIREDEEALELAGGRHSTALTRTGALFADHEEALAVRFSIQWRTRRAEENLAEHLIGMELRGVNQSEDGTHHLAIRSARINGVAACNTLPVPVPVGGGSTGQGVELDPHGRWIASSNVRNRGPRTNVSRRSGNRRRRKDLDASGYRTRDASRRDGHSQYRT